MPINFASADQLDMLSEIGEHSSNRSSASVIGVARVSPFRTIGMTAKLDQKSKDRLLNALVDVSGTGERAA